MRVIVWLVAVTSLFAMVGVVGAGEKEDGKLRIIVFGAHPDDCEIDAGGVAVMWAKAGHHVKFVSTTNGDVGHATRGGVSFALNTFLFFGE